MMKRPFRGTTKAFVRLEEARASKLLKAAHIKIGWALAGSTKKRIYIGATIALPSAMWRRTAEDPIEAVGAGSAARRSTLRSPAQGNRCAISAPHERRNPGEYAMRGISRGSPEQEALEKLQMKTKQAREETRRRSPD